MNLSSASTTSALSARAVPVSATLPLVGKRLTSTAEIGSSIAISYPTADIAYAVEIVADATNDEVDLSLETGIATVIAGDPTIVGAAGDFSAVTLPTAVKLMALRVTTPDGNSSAVSISLEVLGYVTLLLGEPGQNTLMAFGENGVDLASGDKLTITFSYPAHHVLIEIIAATA